MIDESYKIYMGQVTKISAPNNKYVIELIATEEEISRIGYRSFVGEPLSFMSDSEKGSGMLPTYKVGDLVMFMIPFSFTDGKLQLVDNQGFIMGAVSREGRGTQYDNQMTLSSGKGARITVEDQYPTSGSEGNILMSGRRMGILSGDGYIEWGNRLDWEKIFLPSEEDYSGGQIQPAVPSAGLFLSRDTGEKIWLNSGSIVMAAYGFNIIASGSLSGGDPSNPTWDIVPAASGTISIIDNNGNSIVLDSTGVNINSSVEIGYTSDGDITISSQGKVIVNAADQIELNGNSNTIIANGDNVAISGVSNFKIDGLVTVTYMTGYTTNMGPVVPSTAMVQSMELKAGNLSINEGVAGQATIEQKSSRKVKTS